MKEDWIVLGFWRLWVPVCWRQSMSYLWWTQSPFLAKWWVWSLRSFFHFLILAAYSLPLGKIIMALFSLAGERLKKKFTCNSTLTLTTWQLWSSLGIPCGHVYLWAYTCCSYFKLKCKYIFESYFLMSSSYRYFPLCSLYFKKWYIIKFMYHSCILIYFLKTYFMLKSLK